jgi:adenine C2-methylase RlmN of 23S rRNA A2503 and tRNA A37
VARQSRAARRRHQRPVGRAWPARPITNVVLMGMGEPLANYDNVVAACASCSMTMPTVSRGGA